METLDRDGVRLAYAEAGEGDPIVLVHGWCCDSSFFQPQFDHFAEAGRRVIAFDLRGHGSSDAPVCSYTIGLFADDIAWCLKRLDVERPVVIGHSLGGIVAFDLAARYRDLASSIVMIDSSVVRPGTSLSAITGLCKALAGPERIATVRAYVTSALFIASDDADRKARLLDRMASAPAHVMLSAMEGLRDYDPAYARGLIDVPSLYIAANEPGPRCDVARLRELVPHLMTGQTVGSGHFCQLEVPDQINAMLARFLALQSLTSFR